METIPLPKILIAFCKLSGLLGKGNTITNRLLNRVYGSRNLEKYKTSTLHTEDMGNRSGS